MVIQKRIFRYLRVGDNNLRTGRYVSESNSVSLCLNHAFSFLYRSQLHP